MVRNLIRFKEKIFGGPKQEILEFLGDSSEGIEIELAEISEFESIDSAAEHLGGREESHLNAIFFL